MRRTRLVLSACAAASCAIAAPAAGQTVASASTGPHLIVIKLVEHPADKIPFAFEPLNFTAQRGDTLRFVQVANTMHNVRFKTQPKGTHLGSAATSPYLTTKGQTFTIVVDGRFAPGKYEIVCDPHELIGMHAFLTVEAPGAVATKQ